MCSTFSIQHPQDVFSSTAPGGSHHQSCLHQESTQQPCSWLPGAGAAAVMDAMSPPGQQAQRVPSCTRESGWRAAPRLLLGCQEETAWMCRSSAESHRSSCSVRKSESTQRNPVDFRPTGTRPLCKTLQRGLRRQSRNRNRNWNLLHLCLHS